MRPAPEVAMPVSTIVSLNSKSQRFTLKTSAVECDLPEKKRVGVWRSRESNPALIAQRDPKRGTVAEIPGDGMPINLHRSPAGVFVDSIVADSKVKWILSSRAELQPLQGKSLNEGLRLPVRRKPCGPHLHRHPLRVSRAAASPWIHQQISEPPGSFVVRQSDSHKPDFVTPSRRQRGKYFVEGLHRFHEVLASTSQFSEKGFRYAIQNYLTRIPKIR